MYLIYVDDYGNTGNKLNDPKQPVFMLFALLIPDDRWVVLEGAISDILREIVEQLPPSPKPFELHAADFFSTHNRVMQSMSLEVRAHFAQRIAQAVKLAGGSYLASYVDKPKLALVLEYLTPDILAQVIQNVRAEGSGYSEGMRNFNYSGISLPSMTEMMKNVLMPYPLGFSSIVKELDLILSQKSSLGMILIDQQQQFAHATKLKLFSALRHPSVRGIRNVLELPVALDSKNNIFLQVADLAGYLVGMSISAMLGYRRIPERHEQTISILREDLVLVDAFGEGVKRGSNLLLGEITKQRGTENVTAQRVQKLVRDGLVRFDLGEKIPLKGWGSETTGLSTNFPPQHLTTSVTETTQPSSSDDITPDKGDESSSGDPGNQ